MGTDAPAVYVVDDHRFVADAVVQLLITRGYRAAAATTDSELAALMQTGVPSLLLCDLSMPDMDGFAVIERFHGQFPVVALTALDQPSDMLRAIQAGASGFVSKLVSSDRLGELVADALTGNVVMDEGSLGRLFHHLRESSAQALTAREAEVASLLVAGRTNQQIAAELYVGIETVRSHLRSVYEKLGVSTRSDAVAELRRKGLTGPAA